MKLKEVTKLGNGLFILGIAMLVVAIFIPGMWRTLLGLSGLAVAVIGMVLFVFLWKCPECGEKLPSRGSSKLTKCPHCGCDLTDA